MRASRQCQVPVIAAGVAALVLCLAGPAGAQPGAAARIRLALTDAPAGAALRLLDEAGHPGFSIAVRVRVSEDELVAQTLDARLAALEQRGLPLWLTLPAPARSEDVPRWRERVRALVGRRQSTLAILETVVETQPPALAAFAVQIAATEARARRPGVQMAIGGLAPGDSARREAIYTATLAPYVDLLVAQHERDPALASWLRAVDPDARVAIDGPADSPVAPERVVDAAVDDLDTEAAVRAWTATAVSPASIRALAPLAALLTNPISTIDPAGVGLGLTVAQQDVAPALRHRLLFNNETFATYLIYRGEAAAAPLQISLRLPVEGRPGVHDLITGERLPVLDYARDAASGLVRTAAPLTGRPMLVDFNEEATVLLADRAEAAGRRELSIEEIIARHQQMQVTQDNLVRHYSAAARMRQYFRPTITDAGYDVVTENRYFVEGEAIEWEELSFSVNGSRWGADRPPFPLLQPEKVLSIPLQLRFDEGYAYRLRGIDRVDGFDCYVVQFEPLRQDSALYRGTVWIDRQTFARVRVQAVQGGLPAPVVSSEETLHYTHVTTIENQPIFLFTSLSAKQIVLIAGRNLLVEKTVTFSGFRVNDDAFDESRRAARASDRIMFRETDAGLRHYVKEGGTRVVEPDPTTRVKAMAMGVYVDPSYAFPLPIFGINYLDFAVGGSARTQFALLFGGVLAAGNVQRPRLGSPALNASLDFFAIAVPSSDRLYGPDGEIETARVLTWPMSTGLNLGWQATPFIRATLQYQFRFDAYVRDRTTAATFDPPASTVTNGIGGAWEYRRGGYNVFANAAWFVRGRWDDWGEAGTVDPTQPSAADARTYVKYTVGASKEFLVGPFQKIHVDGAWFGGRDLDRFVQYQFGMFDDTRVHGVPASGVRFAELAMTRGAYSFNVFEQYRLDLFVEHAWGRSPMVDASWQSIPGIGVAVNFRAPRDTILRAEVGKSLLPERYRGIGSTTLQVMLLKPMR